MKNIEELLKIINTVLDNRDKVLIAEISENTSLRDGCGMDSLDLADLTVRIEAAFDVDIFEDGVVETIGDILKKIYE